MAILGEACPLKILFPLLSIILAFMPHRDIQVAAIKLPHRQQDNLCSAIVKLTQLDQPPLSIHLRSSGQIPSLLVFER
jgi:hypothetical protein